MKNPFKFLPKLKVNHTCKSMFDAVGVKKTVLEKFNKKYYLYIEELVISKKLEGVHAISESIIMEFLMDQNYDSINEMIIIPIQFREFLGSGAFEMEACISYLGMKRSSVLALSSIRKIADLAKISNHPDADEIETLLNLSLDKDYMQSISNKKREEILMRLKELKESVMELTMTGIKKERDEQF